MKLRSLWFAAAVALILSVGLFPNQWDLLLGIDGTSVYGPDPAYARSVETAEAPSPAEALDDLESEAYAERFYRASLTPEMAELVLSPAEIHATYRWKGPLSSGPGKLPDSLYIVGVGEVGRHHLNTEWHEYRKANFPFYIEWMQSVDDTMGVIHDLRGWGVRALDAAQDSVLRGGDGIADNGDEWSTTVSIISDTTEFRQCAANASSTTLDVCTFDAGGLYDLQGGFHPAGDNVYLAAHANPGGGVTVNSSGARWRWTNNVSDVVIRGLRIAMPGGNQILNENISNVVLYEHTGRYGAQSGGHGNLIGWSPETDAGESADYLTIQRSLCHSSDADHPTCASFGGFSSRTDPASNISIHETVFADYQHRTVMCNSQEAQQTYSVVYNWDSRGLETNNDYSCDVWGGYHKVGPGTNTGTYNGEAVTAGDQNCDLDSDPNNGDNDCSGALYVSKMRVSNTATPYDSTLSLDEMRTGNSNAANRVLGCRSIDALWCAANGDTLPTIDATQSGSSGSGTWDFTLSSTRVTQDVSPSWAQPAEGAMSDSLFEELVGVSGEAIGTDDNGAVGAYRSLNADGTWRRTQDAPDTLALFQVLDSTGDTSFQQRDGETSPTPSAGTPYTDSDADGMPADYESQYAFLSDSDATDRDEDEDGDGRLNLIEYLDGTEPDAADTPGQPAAQTASADVLIPGVYGDGARTMLDRCNMDTVFVYKAPDAEAWDSVNNILETGPHPDTAKLVLGGTGGRAATGFGGDGADCVYWAGHTAQGGGVEIRNDYNNLRHLRWDDPANHDFVVRGFTWSNPARDAASSVPMKNIENIQGLLILENLNLHGVETTGWDFGPTASSDSIDEVTIWREMVALCGDEPVAFGITNGTAGGYISNLSFGQVVYHTCSHREPLLDTDADPLPNQPEARVVGQLSYNHRQGVALGSGWYMDVMDQYTMPGPFTDSRYEWSTTLYVSQAWSDDSRLYVDRLIGASNRDTSTITDSLWADGGAFQEVACYYRECVDPGGGGDPRDSLGAGVKVDTPTTGPTYPLERVDPFTDIRIGLVGDSAEEIVGNSRMLNCSGTLVFRPDSLREALMQELRDSTGRSTSVDSTFVESVQDYTRSAGTACTDADDNGLFDDFETTYWGSTGQSNSADPDNDGYPNWLEMVNGTDPTVSTASDGTESGGGGGGSAPAYTYDSRWVLRAPTVNFCPPTGDCGGAGAISQIGSTVTDTDSLLAHATPTGSDRVQVVVTGQISGSNPAPDSVLSGGVQMTQVAEYNEIQNGSWQRIRYYILEESEITSRSGGIVEVFWNAVPAREFLISAFYENVDQTTPVGDTASAGSGASTTTISSSAVTTSSDDLVLSTAVGGDPGTAVTWSWNNSFVEDSDFAFGSDYQVSNATKAATGANETPSSDASSALDRAGINSIVLQTAGGAPASDTIPNLIDPDSVPRGEVQCAGLFYNSDSTEALCVAFAADTPSVTTGLLDSATADSISSDTDVWPARDEVLWKGVHSPAGFMSEGAWRTRSIRQDREMGAQVWRTVWRPENIATDGSGGRDWSFLDSLITEADSRGLEIILHQERSPTWLVGSDETAVPGDTTDQAFIDFHAAIAAEAARRYEGQVFAWEFWNEPNLQVFWDPTDANLYADAYDAWYDSVTAADPDVFKVAGAISSQCCVGGSDISGSEFLSTLISEGVTLDILSYHPYSDSGHGPEADRPFNNDFMDFTALLDTLDAHTLDTRLWLDEFGWSLSDTTETERARMLGEAFDSAENHIDRVDLLTVFISEATFGPGGNDNYGLRDVVSSGSPDATYRESGDTVSARMLADTVDQEARWFFTPDELKAVDIAAFIRLLRDSYAMREEMWH